MADGTTLPGTGVVVQDDEVTTVNGGAVAASKVQRVKVDSVGADGAHRDTSTTFPFPVAQQGAIPAGANTIGTVNTLDPDTTGSGTISVTDAVVAAPGGAGALVSGASTAGSLVAILCPGGDSAWNVQITALTTGTLYFEGSLDSTNGTDGNWINVNGRRTGVVNTELAGNATANGVWRGNTSGLKYFRVRSVGALTGTPAIVIRLSAGSGAIFLNASTPAGTNNIGDVDVLTLPAIPAGANLIGQTGDLDRRAYVIRNFIMDVPTASPAAEALCSVVQWYNNAAVAATTTPAVVPTGKILAITAMRINTASLAAAGMVKVRLRVNTAGLAAATSPLVCALQCGSVAAVAALQSNQVVTFPKPFLIPAGAGLGITHQGYVGATATLQSFTTVDVWGYEYTA